VGVISCRISACYFPLPLVPSRRGRGKFTFYEFIIYDFFIFFDETEIFTGLSLPSGWNGIDGAGFAEAFSINPGAPQYFFGKANFLKRGSDGFSENSGRTT